VHMDGEEDWTDAKLVQQREWARQKARLLRQRQRGRQRQDAETYDENFTGKGRHR